MPRFLMVVGIGAVIAFVALSFESRRQRQATYLKEAQANGRSLSLELSTFEAEYGRYPDAITAPLVKEKTATLLTLGQEGSNQILRQLIANGFKSEKLFFAASRGGVRPDDLFGDDEHALAPGECGFAYIAGFNSAGERQPAMLICPMVSGTLTFDPAPFGSKAVVVFLKDHSSRVLPVDSKGRAMMDGMDLFDLSQPLWQGKSPEVFWQETPLKGR